MNYKCVNCGKTSLANQDTVVVTQDNGTHIFCRKCAAQFGTCAMCQHNTPCGFFNDPDPMPQFKVIMRQTRQGNATFVEQVQVPNSDRVKKFCVKCECKCLTGMPDEPLCCRHGGYTTCTNYCEKEKHNFVQDFSIENVSEN
jgi:hypothetical protein